MAVNNLESAMIDQGSVFPAFDMPADDGKPIRSKDLAGQPYVIYFYPKDDTSGCTLEGQQFSALMKDFRAAGARVIGVSPDSVESHCKFRDKYDLSVTLAADVDKRLCEACGLWVEKSMYGKTYMGVERTTYLVDAKGRVQRIWTKVKVSGHAEEVLGELRSSSKL